MAAHRIQVGVDKDKVVRSRIPNQWARSTHRAAHPAHPCNSNSIPDPFSGVKSFEKAEMRRVLIVAVPRMFAETFQLPLVSPAFCTNGAEKVTFRRVKGEIALEANEIKAGVYVCGDHRLNDNGGDWNRSREVVNRQRYRNRCWRRRWCWCGPRRSDPTHQQRRSDGEHDALPACVIDLSFHVDAFSISCKVCAKLSRDSSAERIHSLVASWIEIARSGAPA